MLFLSPPSKEDVPDFFGRFWCLFWCLVWNAAEILHAPMPAAHWVFEQALAMKPGKRVNR